MKALIALTLSVAVLVSGRGRLRVLPLSGCYQVTYADWVPGGEGRPFYEPLPKLVDLRDELDTLARLEPRRVSVSARS